MAAMSDRCRAMQALGFGSVWFVCATLLAVTVEQDAFNYYHSSSRMSVEGTFGEYSQRWGVLWRPLRCSEVHATLLLSALAKLHNLCVDGGHCACAQGSRCIGNLPGDVDGPLEEYMEIAPDGSHWLPRLQRR